MVLLNVRWEQVGMGMGRVGLDRLEPNPLGMQVGFGFGHTGTRPTWYFTVPFPRPALDGFYGCHTKPTQWQSWGGRAGFASVLT